MQEFIHTFSGVTYLTLPQFYRMKASYNEKEFFLLQKRKMGVLKICGQRIPHGDRIYPLD